MSTSETDVAPSQRLRNAAVALVATFVAMAVIASSATAGDLRILKGGYRDPGSNSGSSYANPLEGAVLEYDTALSFGAPTDFAPTDSAGEAVVSQLPANRYYARERTAPPGWSPISSLVWNGATRDYVGRADVGASGVTTAEVDDLRRFINVADNPPVPATCDTGIRVLLLLDRSGSTRGFNDDYRAAANTFIDTLAGTPTGVKISSFATDSTPGSTVYDLETPAGVADAKAEILSIYPTNTSGSGATNWDQALQDAAQADVDVIVFVTDGNPTVNAGDLSTGANVSIRDVAYGIASANLAKYPKQDQKLAKQRIIGVGVGGGISLPNLMAVSGPVEGDDYVVSNDPAELAKVLAAVASAICAGTVTVEKKTVPASDAGLFDLEIDGSAVGGPYGNGGSTGPQTLRIGTYTVSESGAEGTDLSAYRSTVECRDDDTEKVVASGKGTKIDVAIGTDQDVTCTFTNTRKGTLTVSKELPIEGDQGLFDLLVDGEVLAADVGAGGTTGPQILEPGTYTVAEAAGTGTTLAAYRTSVTCKDRESVLIDGAAATTVDVKVADGQDVACAFTNTRKGTVEVVKSLVPATDTGTFDLAVDGQVAAAGIGNGGTTGPQIVDGESVVVSEAAAGATSLADYASTVTCTDGEETVVPTTAGTSTTVPVEDGQNVICTFVNTFDAPVEPTVDPTPPAVIAPPVVPGPIVLPPATIRGAAGLRGPRGCVRPGVVRTRVTGRNMAMVTFIRNGRVVQRVKLEGPNALRQRTVVLRTRIAPSDFRRYRVVARVTYVEGATPRTKTMQHVFRQCARSSVTG